MDDPITVRYHWKPAELTEAWSAHGKPVGSSNSRLAILILLLSIGGAVGYLRTRNEPGKPRPPIPPPEDTTGYALLAWTVALLAVLLLFFRKKLARWWARRSFDKAPGAESVVECVVDSDQVSIRASHVATTMLWAAFLKVAETPKGFLLYQNPTFFNWLPAHGFASESELRRFAELARDKVKTYVVKGGCQFVGKPDSILTDEL